jgi:hypothetical protein
MQCGLDVRNRNGIASDCLVVHRKKSVGIIWLSNDVFAELSTGTSRWPISFYREAGRQRGNRRPPVAPDKLEAPSPSAKPGPHTINFTDQGPPKGERTMIETPVLILIVLMAIGAIVWWRASL